MAEYSKAPQPMAVSGWGVLTRPCDDFAEDFETRFDPRVQLVAYDGSSDGWQWSAHFIVCDLDSNTVAEMKDYLETYFPSDGGQFSIGGVVHELFEIIPGFFFATNVSDVGDLRVKLQLLDRFGRGKETGIVRPTDPHPMVGATSIPAAVIEAGLRQPIGQGDFLDAIGRQVAPCDFDKLYACRDAS